jgi:hypothetical protein
MEDRIIQRIKGTKYIEHAMSWDPSTKLYSIITQKTIVMRTSNQILHVNKFLNFIIMQNVLQVFVNSLFEILYISYLYFDNAKQNNSECIVRLKSTLIGQHVQLVNSTTAGSLHVTEFCSLPNSVAVPLLQCCNLGGYLLASYCKVTAWILS